MPKSESSAARMQPSNDVEKKPKASHLRVVQSEEPKNRTAERAPTPPNPFEEDEPGTSLVRDKKTGRVTTLRADERFITLKEAYQYLADRRTALNEELEDFQTAGVLSKEKRRELEGKQKELDRLQKEADDSFKSEAAKSARYSGAGFLIENPMFQEKDEALEVKEGEYDVESAPEVLLENTERQRKELDELYRKRNQLLNARDGIMHGLKSGDAPQEFVIGAKRIGAAIVGEQSVQYPNYFPADMKKEGKRRQLLHEAAEMEETLRKKKGTQQVVKMSHIGKQWELNAVSGKLAGLKTNETVAYPEPLPREKARSKEIGSLSERKARLKSELAPHQRANVGEALREVLDELDDVQEAIVKQERNVQFLDKMGGKKTGSKKK